MQASEPTLLQRREEEGAAGESLGPRGGCGLGVQQDRPWRAESAHFTLKRQQE